MDALRRSLPTSYTALLTALVAAFAAVAALLTKTWRLESQLRQHRLTTRRLIRDHEAAAAEAAASTCQATADIWLNTTNPAMATNGFNWTQLLYRRERNFPDGRILTFGCARCPPFPGDGGGGALFHRVYQRSMPAVVVGAARALAADVARWSLADLKRRLGHLRVHAATAPDRFFNRVRPSDGRLRMAATRRAVLGDVLDDVVASARALAPSDEGGGTATEGGDGEGARAALRCLADHGAPCAARAFTCLQQSPLGRGTDWAEALLGDGDALADSNGNAGGEVGAVARALFGRDAPALAALVALSESVARGAHLWLAPAGKVSALHNDWNDNVLVNLRGRKRVTLLDPAALGKLYPAKLRMTVLDRHYEDEGDGSVGGFSARELDGDRWQENYPLVSAAFARGGPAAVDPERFPRFAELLGTPHLQTVELGPGDALLLPMLWWHHVENWGDGEGGDGMGSLNLAVNFWFQGHSIATRLFRTLRENVFADGDRLGPEWFN